MNVVESGMNDTLKIGNVVVYFSHENLQIGHKYYPWTYVFGIYNVKKFLYKQHSKILNHIMKF